MLDVLMASGPAAQVKTPWLTASIVTHALVIALAVVATRAALNAPPLVPRESMILLFTPKPPEPPPPPQAKPEHSTPIVSLAAPPPQGFQTVIAPTDMPKMIPPVDLNQRPLDPRDFTGQGVEGGVAEGVVGGTGPVTMDAIYEATTNLPGFQPAVVLSQPAPQYPAALASVGLEGRVSLEFVIDTSGKVERTSIKVLESTHPAFEAAARSAIAGSLFRPARVSAVAVRQLSRQSVRFVETH
jgi:TonB family protein